MRALSVLSVVVLATSVLAGCADVPPPTPVVPEPPAVAAVAVEAPPDATPKVVRRLVAEARQQVEKNRAMIADLHDARGRARAQDEADTLERELVILAARIEDASSDNLDDVMNRLQLLDTRIDLLHDKLVGATERTSAFTKD